MMKLSYALLACFVLVGCEPKSSSALDLSKATPDQVVASAHLSEALAHPDELIVAEADGQCIIGDDMFVLLNGAEAKQFLSAHGYAKTLRSVTVSRTPNTIEVEVEIEGKDGAKGTLNLYTDGEEQGRG